MAPEGFGGLAKLACAGGLRASLGSCIQWIWFRGWVAFAKFVKGRADISSVFAIVGGSVRSRGQWRGTRRVSVASMCSGCRGADLPSGSRELLLDRGGAIEIRSVVTA